MCEKVKLIRKGLIATQDRQRQDTDKKRRYVELYEGDKSVKISPMKEVVRWGKKGKLSPHYAGPFEILEKVGIKGLQTRPSTTMLEST